jgi:outer membrane protein OmpA-like peptidoglycan-associated protein
MRPMRPLALCVAAALVAVAALAQAAEPEKEPVLKEGRFTQDDLIRQFDQPRMRSWSPSVVGGAAAVAAPTAKASILITFVTGSAELTPQARKSLDVLAGAMKNDRLAQLRFTIEGHADPRGQAERNQALSLARADSVRAYLTGTHGVAAERVDAVGKGATELMNPGQPAAPENRRVTIVAQPRR